MSALTVRVLDAPPAAWGEQVAEDPNATPAHRSELWEAVAAVLPGTRVVLFAAFDAGRLAGGAPVAVERIAGITRLHAMPWVLPGAPLARPGLHERVDAAIAASLAERAGALGAIGGEWSLYRPRGPAVSPAAIERVPGETTWLETAVLDLAAGGGSPPPVDRKTRSDLRHARASGLALREAPERLDEAWALHAAQSSRWPGHRPLPLELCRRLLARPVPVGRLFVLEDGGDLASAAFVLDHPREALVWWSGTPSEGRGRHAFAFLLRSVAAWAAEAGRERLNLGASPGLDTVAAFKRSLGARGITHPVRWLRPAPASWPARLAAAAQAFVRRGRRRGSPG